MGYLQRRVMVYRGIKCCFSVSGFILGSIKVGLTPHLKDSITNSHLFIYLFFDFVLQCYANATPQRTASDNAGHRLWTVPAGAHVGPARGKAGGRLRHRRDTRE